MNKMCYAMTSNHTLLIANMLMKSSLACFIVIIPKLIADPSTVSNVSAEILSHSHYYTLN